MFRKTIFWLHLAAGLVAGVAIAVMCFTGAALAFEKEIIGWVERDARRVEPPAAGTNRLALEELLARIRVARPDARVASLAVADDPAAAVAVGLPGNALLYINPYSGEVREAHSPRTRAFMQSMRGWHTRLNVKPGPGNVGSAVNGAANVAFVFLCLSGLVLWWPRSWNPRTLRPSLWFVPAARGRARDWNWHNTFGFWCLIPLLVMALTGVVLSYRWANDFAFRMAGDQPPRPGVRAPAATPVADAGAVPPRPAPPSRISATPDALFAAAQREFPRWTLITLRYNPPLRLNAAGERPAPDTFIVGARSRNQWPPFSTSTVILDGHTATVSRSTGFANLPPGQRARMWIRLLHSGEAFRWPGQLFAGAACLAGCLLVWTGVALAWRRFFGRGARSA